MLYNQLLGGAAVSMGWEPEQYPVGGPIQEHVFTSTLAPGGGQPLPLYDTYRWFHHEFPPGTALYPVTSSSPSVLALANADRTLLINTLDATQSIVLDGVRFDIAPYEVTLRELDGTRVPPVHVQAPAAPGTAARSPAEPTVGDAAPRGSEPYVDAPLEEFAGTPAASVSADPPLDWLDQSGMVGADRANDVAIADGAVFALGSAYGAIGTAAYRGGNDAWLRRYDRAGTVVWERQFGSGNDDTGVAVTADPTGVYVVGNTDDAFGGGVYAGGFDVWVRHYDLTGRLLWHRQFGTDWDEMARGVEVVDGVVYVVGSTDGPSFEGLANRGYDDVFLTAFDVAGTRLWTRAYGTTGPDVVTGMTDAGGALALSGFTGGVFDGQSSAGHWDAFLVRVGLDGELQWSREFGTPGDDRAYDVGMVDGDMVVVGRVEGSLGGETYQGLYDGFVRRYAPDGSLVWHRAVATGRVDRAVAFATDSAGAHVLAVTDGVFPGQVRAGGDDLVVVDLGSDGSTVSLSQWGSDKADDASALTGDLTRIVIAGSTYGVLPGGSAPTTADALPPPAYAVPVDGFIAQRTDPSAIVAADDFERANTTGWGSAPYGGLWRLSNRTPFAIASGTGVLALDAGVSASATLDAVSVRDVVVSAPLSVDRLPVGASAYVSVGARAVAGGSEYRLRLQIQSNGTASLRLLRINAFTPVTLNAEVPIGALVPGQAYRLELEVEGADPTTIQGRVVPATGPVPDWQVSVADATPALQGPGAIGVRATMAGSGPRLTITFDDLLAVRP
jgi:hypothetical protein